MNLCLHDCLHRQEEVISGADALIVREPSVPFVDDAPPQAQTGGPTRNLPRKGSKLTRFNQGFMRRSCALGDGGSSEGEQLGFPAPLVCVPPGRRCCPSQGARIADWVGTKCAACACTGPE